MWRGWREGTEIVDDGASRTSCAYYNGRGSKSAARYGRRRMHEATMSFSSEAALLVHLLQHSAYIKHPWDRARPLVGDPSGRWEGDSRISRLATGSPRGKRPSS